MKEFHRAIPSLSPGQRYVVRVRGFSRLGVASEWSEALDLTPPFENKLIDSLENVRLGVGTTSAVLKWMPSQDRNIRSGRGHYQVQLDTFPNFTGGWLTFFASDRSGGSAKISSTVGAFAEIDFVGETIRWIGARDNNYGIARVSIDDGSEEMIDLYSTELETQKVLFEEINLDPGEHTLRIEVTGDSDINSGGAWIEVDAIEAEGLVDPPVDPLRFEETEENVFTFDGVSGGNWETIEGVGLSEPDNQILIPRSGGSAKRSDTIGDFVEIEFIGSTLRIIGTLARVHGIASIEIDEVSFGTIDFFVLSQTPVVQQVVFEETGLGSGSHVARIEVTGGHNQEALGTWIEIDAIEAFGIDGVMRFEENHITFVNPEEEAPLHDVNVDATLATLGDLLPSTTHYARVRAVDGSGNVSEWSSVLSGTTLGVDGRDFIAQPIVGPEVGQGAVGSGQIAPGTIEAIHLTQAGPVITNIIQISEDVIQELNITSVTDDIEPSLVTNAAQSPEIGISDFAARADHVHGSEEFGEEGAGSFAAALTLAAEIDVESDEAVSWPFGSALRQVRVPTTLPADGVVVPRTGVWQALVDVTYDDWTGGGSLGLEVDDEPVWPAGLESTESLAGAPTDGGSWVTPGLRLEEGETVRLKFFHSSGEAESATVALSLVLVEPESAPPPPELDILDGLVLWLRTDDLVDSHDHDDDIDVWEDQSSEGHVLVPIGAVGPRFKADQIDGHASAAFRLDGQSEGAMFRSGGGGRLTSSTQYSMFVVMRFEDDTSGQWDLCYNGRGDNNGWGFLQQNGDRGVLHGGNSYWLDGEATTDWELWSARRATGAPEFRVNGSSAPVTGSGGVGTPTNFFALGGVRVGSSWFSTFFGHIAELLIYERSLTVDERDQVEEYLMAKYPSLVA